ncbi:Uncharacterized conserved protein, DUF1697 family [Pseudonocardia thermophila]|jgi:Uncharacterized protein conserved in bacteria|uniref:Uncharacterized conserved protein, DUF1697 family n=1 Tax=Pseudonocardia thermophila TaxID=1848 RepID=A0A1M6WAE1_PSETH|nr:DUF1697 domain-containing protein [Pseudonocardia thermophila]SHK90691.1 Uncharacterized conserved protein, DUF1697 family [Pseudonocardia thermophila]
MARYAILVRGINVGTAKRVAMADLRAVLEESGFSAVRTHLNSGNAVGTGNDGLDPAEAGARVEEALAARTGVSARTLVLTAGQLRTIAAGLPYAAEMAAVEKAGSRMMAHVLFADPDPALLAEHDLTAIDPGNVQLGERVVYQWCPNGLLESPDVSGWITKNLHVEVTTRNWNTIAKLADLL